jgi:hypothetical protein
MVELLQDTINTVNSSNAVIAIELQTQIVLDNLGVKSIHPVSNVEAKHAKHNFDSNETVD